MLVHLKKQAQIEVLLFNKPFTFILAKYFDYKDIFLIENIIKLSKYIKINNHAIKLKEDK